VSNDLAYYEHSKMTDVKSFITLGTVRLDVRGNVELEFGFWAEGLAPTLAVFKGSKDI
jgi:hypothetical protein